MGWVLVFAIWASLSLFSAHYWSTEIKDVVLDCTAAIIFTVMMVGATLRFQKKA